MDSSRVGARFFAILLMLVGTAGLVGAAVLWTQAAAATDQRDYREAEARANRAPADAKAALKAYRSYLESHPSGAWVKEAQTRVRESEARVMDERTWEESQATIRGAGTNWRAAVAALEGYRKAYPSGAQRAAAERQQAEWQAKATEIEWELALKDAEAMGPAEAAERVGRYLSEWPISPRRGAAAVRQLELAVAAKGEDRDAALEVVTSYPSSVRGSGSAEAAARARELKTQLLEARRAADLEAARMTARACGSDYRAGAEAIRAFAAGLPASHEREPLELAARELTERADDADFETARQAAAASASFEAGKAGYEGYLGKWTAGRHRQEAQKGIEVLKEEDIEGYARNILASPPAFSGPSSRDSFAEGSKTLEANLWDKAIEWFDTCVADESDRAGHEPVSGVIRYAMWKKLLALRDEKRWSECLKAAKVAAERFPRCGRFVALRDLAERENISAGCRQAWESGQGAESRQAWDDAHGSYMKALVDANAHYRGLLTERLAFVREKAFAVWYDKSKAAYEGKDWRGCESAISKALEYRPGVKFLEKLRAEIAPHLKG